MEPDRLKPVLLCEMCDDVSRKNWMRPYVKQILVALVALLAIVYAYDALSVRHRMAAQKQGDPFDSVTYPHLLAIPQKGNKVDYELDATSPMQTVPCVHSLFPHYGYTPCWYVKRNAKLPTQMTILAPGFRFDWRHFI